MKRCLRLQNLINKNQKIKDMEKEIIKEGLKTILTFIEISRVTNEKHIAVKNQDYQKAYDLRCKEVELQNLLPSEERLKELYELL